MIIIDHGRIVADGKAVTQPKDGQVFYSACELRTE